MNRSNLEIEKQVNVTNSVEKYVIPSLGGIGLLVTGEYTWYSVENIDEFTEVNEYYGGCFNDLGTYPAIFCVDASNFWISGNDVKLYTLKEVLSSMKKFIAEASAFIDNKKGK